MINLQLEILPRSRFIDSLNIIIYCTSFYSLNGEESCCVQNVCRIKEKTPQDLSLSCNELLLKEKKQEILLNYHL